MLKSRIRESIKIDMTMPRAILFHIANPKSPSLATCVVRNHTSSRNAVYRRAVLESEKSRFGLLWSIRVLNFCACAARGREHLFEEWLAANPLPASRVRNDAVIWEEQELGFRVNSELRSMVRLKHDGIWWEDQWDNANGKFSWRDTADIFYECLRECQQLVWNNKHKCFIQVNSKAGTEPLVFVPPKIQLPMHASCTASEYLKLLNDGVEKRRFLLALVSSSAAALGVFEDDALVLHKVITAYTVRAKQGKAQLHHLRQGGPGRMSVGGGIRARESERLFSRICEKFGEWQQEIEGCKILYYSGNMRVWNEVYACNDPKLFLARDDIRWHKVPYSVRQPRLRELQRVYYGLSHGAVSYGVP